jgi:hypothetical protein
VNIPQSSVRLVEHFFVDFLQRRHDRECAQDGEDQTDHRRRIEGDPALAEQVTYDLSCVVVQTEMQRQVVIDPLVRECTDENQKWKKRDQQTGT